MILFHSHNFAMESQEKKATNKGKEPLRASCLTEKMTLKDITIHTDENRRQWISKKLVLKLLKSKVKSQAEYEFSKIKLDQLQEIGHRQDHFFDEHNAINFFSLEWVSLILSMNPHKLIELIDAFCLLGEDFLFDFFNELNPIGVNITEENPYLAPLLSTQIQAPSIEAKPLLLQTTFKNIIEAKKNKEYINPKIFNTNDIDMFYKNEK